MAIAFESNLATIRHYGSDQSTRTTGSFTPTAGRVLVVLVDSQNQAGTLNDSTGTMAISNTHAGSWTWTLYGNGSDSTYDPNGATYFGRVHAAVAVVPSSPGSGTITLTFNGGGGSVNRTRNIVIADVLEFSGVDTAAAVVQTKLQRAGAATSHTATLGSTPDTNNAVVSFVGVSYDADHTNVAPPTGHTEVSDYDTANVDFNHSFVDSYDIGSASTSLNFTTFPTSTYGSAIFGVELKEATSGSNYTSTPSDSVTASDSAVKKTTKGFADTTTVSDGATKRTVKSFSDTSTASESIRFTLTKSVSDSVTGSDTTTKTVRKTFSDSATISDLPSKSVVFARTFSDTVTASDVAVEGVARSYSASDTVTPSDSLFKRATKTTVEVVTITDANVKTVRKNIADTATVSDAIGKTQRKTFSETSTVSDSQTKRLNKSFDESILGADAIAKTLSKMLTEIAYALDTVTPVKTGASSDLVVEGIQSRREKPEDNFFEAGVQRYKET